MDCVESVLSMWPGDQMRTVEVRGSLPLTSDWDYSDNGDGQALAAHSTSALALPPDFPYPLYACQVICQSSKKRVRSGLVHPV